MTQSSDNRWIFSVDRIYNGPSKKDGIGHHEQLMSRQKGTNLIREMAQELKLRPIVMQTAMVYFQRFFTLRSFAKFDPYRMAVCALFVASKWDDQPIFRDHIIKLLNICKPQKFPKTKESFNYESELLVENEAEMLYTFGFDMTVIHAHTLIAQDFDSPVISQIIRKNAYIIASDLLRLTTICLEYSPPFIACICIYLASTVLGIQIESNNWCSIIDPTISLSEVQREAERFKEDINMSHLSMKDYKPRSQSFASSPESAYSSSASPESPETASNEQSQNLRLNTIYNQSTDNSKEVNVKKKRTYDEISDRPTIVNPSISRSTSHEKTTSLLKKTAIESSLTCIKQSNSQTEELYRAKCQKVVKSNGDVMRRPAMTNEMVKNFAVAVRPNAQTRRPIAAPVVAPVVCPQNKPMVANNLTSAQMSIASLTKPVKTSSAAQQSTNLKKAFKNMNLKSLKITFSTDDDSVDADTSKRVVCRSEPILNPTHNMKVS